MYNMWIPFNDFKNINYLHKYFLELLHPTTAIKYNVINSHSLLSASEAMQGLFKDPYIFVLWA